MLTPFRPFLIALSLSGALLGCDPVGGKPVQEDPATEKGASDETSTETEESFLRFVYDEEAGSGALETAVVSYEDEAGRRVDLVGAVHVGDRDYYELLNVLFSSYDAVLYEMVKDKDTPVVVDKNEASSVSKFQRAFKDLLGIEFQLDVVDYTAKNFVHADLDPATFFGLQEEKGESIFTLMMQAALKGMEQADENQKAESEAMPLAMMLAFVSQNRGRSLKLLLGRQFADLDRIAAGFEKGLDGKESVLLIDRNKAALAVLKEELEAGKKRCAIFYGAAHLPDMERRLFSEFGFKKVGHEWITAWDIPAKPKKEKTDT